MIERVARAISKQFGVDDPDKMWPYAVPHARAAIEAMREPTDEMVARLEGYEESVDEKRAGWQAAIDVVLK